MLRKLLSLMQILTLDHHDLESNLDRDFLVPVQRRISAINPSMLNIKYLLKVKEKNKNTREQ